MSISAELPPPSYSSIFPVPPPIPHEPHPPAEPIQPHIHLHAEPSKMRIITGVALYAFSIAALSASCVLTAGLSTLGIYICADYYFNTALGQNILSVASMLYSPSLFVLQLTQPIWLSAGLGLIVLACSPILIGAAAGLPGAVLAHQSSGLINHAEKLLKV